MTLEEFVCSLSNKQAVYLLELFAEDSEVDPYTLRETLEYLIDLRGLN